MEKSPAIGIDLGTTYCCVAVYEFGSVKTIPSEQNNRKIPSYVGFTRDGHLLVGEEAKQQVALNSKNTIYNTKRLIGRRHEDDAVKSDMNYLPFNVTNNGGRICFEINFKEQWRKIYPEEITSMILVKMKEVAEAYLDTQVSDVVITVPAYFNNYQRQATKDSSEIAGLNVLRIINETSATALAYGFDKKAQGERNVMVFDLGGGTLDVSIITIDDGCFEVKAVAGDCSLGGEDFDNRLVKHFVKEFKRMYKKDISKDNEMLRCLRNVCEKAKRTLSSYNQAPVEFKSFRSSITRDQFEDLCADLFESVSIPVRQTMKDVNMKTSNIYEVILVGGSTRIPKIRKILQNIFGEKKLNTSMNADEAVAYGAAVQAAMIKGEQGGYLEEMLLLDVCPFSLGIETYGGTMSSLIKRNCTIPTKQIRNTNQTNVSISIYEGEQELIKQNNLLGKFILRGTRQMLARQTIEIIYEIDIDGIFHISAIDKNTGGKMQIITSHDTRSLLQTEIDRMKRQLVVYKCEDERKMYQKLVELEDVWKCVLNVRPFLCCICFSYYKPGEGIVLRECLHIFCRDCLRNLVEYNDEAKICCPFQDDSKKCEYFLQHREIEQVASKEAFNKYLGMSLSLAFYDNIVLESSFRCLTPACPGWCVYECATEFDCPVCNHKNCINCKVIHEGFNCKEYQDDLILRAAHDEEAKQTKLQIDEMIANGSAMNCPKCQVIIVKDIGCDWMQCTICKTEICWATKGARWGPGGKGDTSGGCRCKVNGQPCTPNCMNCH